MRRCAIRLLVSGCTATVRELTPRWPDRLGHLISPSNGNSLKTMLSSGLPFGCDNDCFVGFDEAKYRRFLKKMAGAPRCLFATAPDVVADAKATMASFPWWKPVIESAGLPVALVGQDGVEDLDIPWDDFSAWFVGGSTEWKMSQASADLLTEAKRRGKWCHVGRVNSLKRLDAAMMMGADSVDGTATSRWGKVYIHKFCAWIDRRSKEPVLF